MLRDSCQHRSHKRLSALPPELDLNPFLLEAKSHTVLGPLQGCLLFIGWEIWLAEETLGSTNPSGGHPGQCLPLQSSYLSSLMKTCKGLCALTNTLLSCISNTKRMLCNVKSHHKRQSFKGNIRLMQETS